MTLGYVIIKYNQASGWPEIWSGEDLLDTEAEARDSVAFAREENHRRGRRETYRVARVELGED